MMELVVIKGSKHDNSRKNRRRQVKAALKLEALNEWAAKREVGCHIYKSAVSVNTKDTIGQPSVISKIPLRT